MMFRLPFFALAALSCLLQVGLPVVFGAETTPSPASSGASVDVVFTNAWRPFQVSSYRIKGDPALTNAALVAGLDRFTGTNVTLFEIAQAATWLETQYRQAGYTNVTITLGRDQIVNGVVLLTAFRGAFPQLVIDGRRCAMIEPGTMAAAGPATAGATNAAPKNATSTNTPPGFLVRAYEIRGDTLLSTKTLTAILEKYTGTNISIGDILKAKTELQNEYIQRGYATVRVTVPPQTLDSNAIVKVRVFEGNLAEINVLNNRYFSSNNVMRALPSLHTNLVLLEPVFQEELDRANANPDRQIRAEISPGPAEGTTALDLKVKDRLPLHAKIELNNQSSPGTPELRLNTSFVYNNLWQYEHTFGFQYSFSPEAYKMGDQWAFYDRPLVANYSAFYRFPLGNPEAITDIVTSKPGSFGFNEGTREYQLPPPTGRPELNFYASRSTIDTGLETLQSQLIFNVPGVRQISRQDVQEDITINEDVGFRFSAPLANTANYRSTFSGGLDYKTYSLTGDKTNDFSFTEITVNPNGSTNPPIFTTVSSPVPETRTPLDYLPVSVRYDGNLQDKHGNTSFGLGVTFNTWWSGSLSNWHAATGSFHSSGNWATFTPSIGHDFFIHTNWTLALRADGQWATGPLLSTEKYGVGGVNSVRGYREGEIFGDTGWRVSIEQRTPPHIIGLAYGKTPLTVRGAIYMDYAEAYSLDPNAFITRVPLWGTGFGGVFSLGSHWEARFLFSWPLLSAGTSTAYEPRFNFSLSGQF